VRLCDLPTFLSKRPVRLCDLPTFLSKRPVRLWTYTGSYLKGTRGSSQRSKAAGARSWRRLSGASVTNAWSDTSTFRYVVMVWCVIKQEEIFNV